MCLEVIEKVFLNPTDRDWKTGYKVMSKTLDGKYASLHFPSIKSMIPGVLYTDIKDIMIVLYGYWVGGHDIELSYPTGFHIYVDKNDCFQEIGFYADKSATIVKVKYRRMCAIGTEWNMKQKIVVAKEMMITKEA